MGQNIATPPSEDGGGVSAHRSLRSQMNNPAQMMSLLSVFCCIYTPAFCCALTNGNTHPNANASLKIFEMNEAHAFQQRQTLQTLYLTLTQWCSAQCKHCEALCAQGRFSCPPCTVMTLINDIRHFIQCMYNS